MKHLDLFSGIGGFAIAARNVGWETIGFCEIDHFCLRLLGLRFDCDRWFSLPGHIDSGTPCRTVGLEELVSIRPDWIVIENDYHRWRAWVPELRRSLYRLGYASLPLRVRASEVGGVHHRARGWLVANADSEQLWELSRWWGWQGWKVAQELAESWDSSPRGLGEADGVPDRVDRCKVLGNAIVPRAAEVIFRGIKAMETGWDIPTFV
jgi:DNA (cytosine-5)-methyltransferase 1